MSNLERHETSLVVVLKSHSVQVYLSLYDGYRSNLIMEIDLVRLSSCGEAWNTLPVLEFIIHLSHWQGTLILLIIL